MPFRAVDQTGLGGPSLVVRLDYRNPPRAPQKATYCRSMKSVPEWARIFLLEPHHADRFSRHDAFSIIRNICRPSSGKATSRSGWYRFL
jgi:hypothetical protein